MSRSIAVKGRGPEFKSLASKVGMAVCAYNPVLGVRDRQIPGAFYLARLVKIVSFSSVRDPS